MNAGTDKFDVVIAGGSFAGMALARGLSLAAGGALRIAIVDRRRPGPAVADFRAFAIWNGARRALESIGAWSQIADEAQVVRSIEITDQAVDDVVREARLVYDAKLDDGEPAVHMAPAAVLHDALLATIVGDPSITWLAPAEATLLRPGDRGVEIAFGDGRAIVCDLAIAADGRNSKLRDAAGIKTVGWDYAQTGIVALLQLGDPHDGVAIQHFLPGGPFAILPLRENKACITWSAARDEAARMVALDDAAFLAELDRRIGARFGEIALAGPRQSWPLAFRTPLELVAPRFALIGDAAHGVHPIAGQGVNLALRDAAALTECVIDAMRIGFDAGHAAALERYSRWRRFDSLMSASLYDGLNRLFSVDNVVLRAGRGAGLGLLDMWPDAKRWILTEAAGRTGELPKMMRGLPV